MQFTSLFLLASGFAPALVNAAPQALSIRQDEPLPTATWLFVTLWAVGCDINDDDSSKSTFQFHDQVPDQPGEPVGECVELTAYGWKSFKIQQPTDDPFSQKNYKYEVEVYSGFDCKNLIGTYKDEDICDSAPREQHIQSLIARRV